MLVSSGVYAGKTGTVKSLTSRTVKLQIGGALTGNIPKKQISRTKVEVVETIDMRASTAVDDLDGPLFGQQAPLSTHHSYHQDQDQDQDQEDLIKGTPTPRKRRRRHDSGGEFSDEEDDLAQSTTPVKLTFGATATPSRAKENVPPAPEPGPEQQDPASVAPPTPSADGGFKSPSKIYSARKLARSRAKEVEASRLQDTTLPVSSFSPNAKVKANAPSQPSVKSALRQRSTSKDFKRGVVPPPASAPAPAPADGDTDEEVNRFANLSIWAGDGLNVKVKEALEVWRRRYPAKPESEAKDPKTETLQEKLQKQTKVLKDAGVDVSGGAGAWPKVEDIMEGFLVRDPVQKGKKGWSKVDVDEGGEVVEKVRRVFHYRYASTAVGNSSCSERGRCVCTRRREGVRSGESNTPAPSYLHRRFTGHL